MGLFDSIAAGPVGALAPSLGGLFGSVVGGIADSSGIAPAQIQNPVTPEQIAAAYQNTQGGYSAQQALLAALQAQQGIQNQSNVFNQFQGIANGTGPNPAQAMLNQATGANVANQAALAAGQRGASANVGLIARQAAQQGAQAQQTAAGQGATLQANQSLNAVGAMGNIANQQVGQQMNAVGGLNQYGLQGQANLLGTQGAYNSAAVQNQASTNQSRGQIAGGVLQGAGAGLGAIAGMAHGGQVPSGGPRSHFGQFLAAEKGKHTPAGNMPHEALMAALGAFVPGRPTVKGDSPKNDTVQAVLSPGEIVIPRSIATAKDAPEKAARFVASVLARKGRKTS